ncbi:MAG: O-antigen ligase family protein [Pirellulales bacterium]|nr:O-antigen ligase family protein [Pirellulales bacterium]
MAYRESYLQLQQTRSRDVLASFGGARARLAMTPAVILVFYVWTLLVLLNCYLTPNPYAAHHSGKAGFEGSVVSEAWYVSPAWLILAALAMACLYTTNRFPRDYILYIAIFFQLASGCLTEDIFIKPQTYVYDALMYVTCAMIAYGDARATFRSRWEGRLLLAVYAITCLGLALTALLPETFGHFGNFTRERRGETTLWYAVAHNVLLSSLAVYGLLKGAPWNWKNIAWIMPWAITFCVILMTFTRTAAILDICGFCMAFYLYRPARKVLFFIVLPLAFVASGYITYFVLAENDWNSFIDSEPRLDLWAAHLSAIKTSPLFGVGNHAIEGTYTYGQAFSEIGMLAWASRYGIVFAACMLFMTLRGARCAIKLFAKSAPRVKSSTLLDIACPVIIFTIFFGCVVGGFNRILDFGSFAFYYALFYCYYRVQVLDHQTYHCLKRR